MKRIVFTVSEEFLEVIEIAMSKFGLSTRAEFFRHAALLFLQQVNLLGAEGDNIAMAAGDSEEQVSDFQAQQKELVEFIERYNREHGTNFPLPPTYK